VTHFLHTTNHPPSSETAQQQQQSNVARPQRGNLRSHDDPAASTETSNGEVGHPPTTTTAPARTPVTTNSNTDSMIDSGHFDHHHHNHHLRNQRRPPEPPHICCSSDDPVRDLEVLQQMAEILVAEQELRERKPRKATRMMEDESPMKHTTHTEIQELPILDDTNIHHHGNSDLMLPVEDAIESNSAKRSGSAGIHNDRTNDSHNDEGDDDNDDHSQNHHQQHATQRERQLLLRMSMNTAVAIGLHNFPEGLATFVATLDDPHVGFVLAVAIAIHNIPEGLCVALPVYYATGSRRKAFGWAILSGLSEPLAAVFGYIILANAVTSTTYGILFGIIAGMMVMISTRELLPTAHRYDPTDRVVTYSFIFGMAVLALSLVLFVL
jgi:zinc transporter ZupT